MSATEYAHVRNQRVVDGGYSGALTVTVADGNEGAPTMVFVDAEWLKTRLSLSRREARELGYALMDAARIAGDRWDS